MLQLVKFSLNEEWKGKYAVIGVLMYIFTAVLISFLSISGLDNAHFASVFWIVVIFTTLQGVSKSFIQMRKGQFAFWHQLCTPFQFLSAKLINSTFLMLVYTIFAFALFALMHGVPKEINVMLFLFMTVLTGIGIASVFTISSAIATKTDQAGVLLPVLTFPVILPILLVGMKAGKKAVDGLPFSTMQYDAFLLLSLDVLVITMGLMLMKFVWKD
jgi:heme exporter protein B